MKSNLFNSCGNSVVLRAGALASVAGGMEQPYGHSGVLPLLVALAVVAAGLVAAKRGAQVVATALAGYHSVVHLCTGEFFPAMLYL